MNWTKENKKREEIEERTLEETQINIQKRDFEDLGVQIL